MKKLACLLILVMLCVCAAPVSAAFAAGDGLNLGDPVYSTLSKYSFPELNVTTTEGINTVMITVDNGSIDMPTISGATVYNDLVNRTFIINYDSKQSASDIEAMLHSVQFNCESGKKQQVVIKLQDCETKNIPAGAKITALKIGDDMHYYLFVGSNQPIHWMNAYNNAKQMILMDNQGYLVTVTGAAENSILDNITTQYAWAGSIRNTGMGNDFDNLPSMPAAQGTKDDFYWACGPEAGLKVSDIYTNWTSGEPNNAGNEYAMMLHFTGGGWNDVAPNWPGMTNYFVEFGGYPADDPHNPGDKNVIASDEKTDVKPYNEAAKDLIDEAAEKAKKEIDALDNLTDDQKTAAKQTIDDQAQAQKDKIDNATSIDDIKKIVDDAEESKDDYVDEAVAADFLMHYNIDPTTQDLISETDRITSANAPGIVAGKADWDKLTPKQKAYVNKFLETSTWPELYRYAYNLITPKTGDSTNMPLIALLMLLSTIGLAAATLAKRRFN